MSDTGQVLADIGTALGCLPDNELILVRIEGLLAVKRAARDYFDNYCQDEAESVENCIDDEQHRSALMLQVALGIADQQTPREPMETFEDTMNDLHQRR